MTDELQLEVERVAVLSAEMARHAKPSANVCDIAGDVRWVLKAAIHARRALEHNLSPATAYAIAELVLRRYGAELVKADGLDGMVVGARFPEGQQRGPRNPQFPLADVIVLA